MTLEEIVLRSELIRLAAVHDAAVAEWGDMLALHRGAECLLRQNGEDPGWVGEEVKRLEAEGPKHHARLACMETLLRRLHRIEDEHRTLNALPGPANLQ